jgi:hypothetical protein
LFGVYAIALIIGAHRLAAMFTTGWRARLLGMALVFLGLVPWLRWLRPRIEWLLGRFGSLILSLCYLAIFPLFVAATWRQRRSWIGLREVGMSRWRRRGNPVPDLYAARVEY